MSNKPTEYVFELRVDLDVRSYGEAVDRVLDAMLAADIPASLHTARPAAPPADELEDRLNRLLERLDIWDHWDDIADMIREARGE